MLKFIGKLLISCGLLLFILHFSMYLFPMEMMKLVGLKYFFYLAELNIFGFDKNFFFWAFPFLVGGIGVVLYLMGRPKLEVETK